MAVLPKPLADKVRGFAALIPDEDLYDDGSGEHGREEEPHVTVKYGLHTDQPGRVRAVLENNPPCRLTLGRMDAFHNEKYVVLKLEVNSPDLHALNKQISENLECTDTFPVYHPHVTVAYLKHREGDANWYRKLFSDMFVGEEAEMDKLLFSTAEDKDYWIDLTGAASKAAARVAMTQGVAFRFMYAREKRALMVGETFENDAFRAQRGMSTLRITDLTNAGKRGKKVEEIALYNLDYADDFDGWNRDVSFGNLKKERTYAGARSWAESLYEFLKEDNGIPVGMEKHTKRGIDVTPGGFKPIKIRTKYIRVDAGYDRFSVEDLVDQNNLPTCIPRFDGGKRDIKVFYRWVKDNEARIRNMTYSEVLSEMRKNGIQYHSYCAMD